MRHFAVLTLFLGFAGVVQAHVGNPDVYFDGAAGPYRIFVTVRPPVVIPGVAEIEIRTQTPGVRTVHAVPVPLNAAESKLAPVADMLKASDRDKAFFTGSLWIMAAGSWQVRLTVDGAGGQGSLALPVPSVATTTKKMQTGLGIMLGVLMILLVAGVVLMMGASVREAKLEPGAAPSPAAVKRARIAMAITFATIAAVLLLGWKWWDASEQEYRRNIFRPMQMRASLDGNSGELKLNLADPETRTPASAAPLRPVFFKRTVDDLVPDHNHLMHLYALREPGLDVVYHLHPQPAGPGLFRLALPQMTSGRYRLYADVVHANGFPETLVTTVDVPAGLKARPLAGDDASGTASSWSPQTNSVSLADGYRMVWKRPVEEIRAKEPRALEFLLLDKAGKPPADMALYMGMPGHAAFVKTDGTTFAHIHPSGTISMASFMMAQEQLNGGMSGMDHSAHDVAAPSTVAFPYGFPTPGRYRIVVQMKHGETIETGIFDTAVQ